MAHKSDPSTKRYDGFISYSHAADGLLSAALQRALQRFAKPWYRLRALRLFRDTTSLAASPGLWSSIRANLLASEHFLFLASPLASGSTWVQKELRLWLDERTPETLLLVLTEGEIAWDGERGDFDWSRTTALPDLLAGVFAEEPAWVDLRGAKRREELSLRHGEFRRGVASLAAALHGRSKEELDGEDLRQHRRTMRTARVAILALVALAAAASIGFYTARQRSREVTRRLAESHWQTGATEQGNGHPVASGFHFLRAATLTADEDTRRNARLAALERQGEYSLEAIFEHSMFVRGAEFLASGERLLTWSPDGVVGIWSVDSGGPLHRLDVGSAVLRAVPSPDGRRVLTTSHGGRVDLWDTVTGQRLMSAERRGPAWDGVWSADGSRFLTWSSLRVPRQQDRGDIDLWSGETGERICGDTLERRVKGAVFGPRGERFLVWAEGAPTRGVLEVRRLRDCERELALPNPRSVDGARFLHGGREILTWSAEGCVRSWSALDGTLLAALSRDEGGRRCLAGEEDHGDYWQRRDWMTHRDGLTSVALTGDQKTLLSTSYDGSAALWSLDDLRLVREIRTPRRMIGGAFSRDDKHFLSWGDDGAVRLVPVPQDDGSGQGAPVAYAHDNRVAGAVLSRDGSRLLSWSDDGTARVWDTVSQEVRATLHHAQAVSGAAWSPQGDRIVTWGLDGVARLWRFDAARQAVDLAHLGRPGGSGPVIDPRQGRLLTFSGRTATLSSSAGSELVTFEHSGPFCFVYGGLFLDGGGSVITWDSRGGVRRWSAETGDQLGGFDHGDSAVAGAELTRDGQRLLTWGSDKTARLWRLADGSEVFPALEHDGLLHHATLTDDQSRIVTGPWSSAVTLWDATSGAPVRRFEHGAQVRGMLFDTTEERLLSWGASVEAKLWRVGDGELLRAIEHENVVGGAAFDAAESRIVTWDENGLVLVTPLGGVAASMPMRHEQQVTSALFSRSGDQLLTASHDGTARLWDLDGGEPVHVLSHRDLVHGAVFDSTATRVLTWGRDGMVAVWDRATGDLLATVWHRGGVYGAGFAGRTGEIVSWGADGRARFTTLSSAPELDEEDLVRRFEVRTGTRLNEQGKLEVLEPAEWRAARSRLAALEERAAR